jgi:hypothetical protein
MAGSPRRQAAHATDVRDPVSAEAHIVLELGDPAPARAARREPLGDAEQPPQRRPGRGGAHHVAWRRRALTADYAGLNSAHTMP